MTTVIARDGILIADSRTGFGKRFENYQTGKPATKHTFLDDTSKVVRLNKDASFTYLQEGKKNSERAYACAGAGKSRFISRLYSYLNKNNFKEFNKDIYPFSKIGYYTESNNGIIFLTESHTVTYLFRPNKEFEEYTVIEKRKNHSKLTGIGTGWAGAKNILKLVGDKLTVKECFIFASYLDPYSSCDYTMYDSKTKVYTKLTKTKNSEIKEVVEKVQSLVKFYQGPKVTKRLIKIEED